MNYKMLVQLILGLLSVSSVALAEICSDVRQSVYSKNLSIRLQAEEPWYLSGEVVRFKLVFENRSSRSILIPPSFDSIGGYIAQMFLVKYPEAPEGIWTDYVTRGQTPSMVLGWEPCKVTMNPRVLLPGDVFVMEVSPSDGSHRELPTGLLASWAPVTPGLHKFRYVSDNFEIRTDLLVKQIDSYEMRWLADSSAEANSTRLRPIWLVRVDGQSLFFVNASWNGTIKTEEVANYLEREDYLSSLNRADFRLRNVERIFAVQEELQFTDRSNRILRVDREISFSSKGSIIRKVNPADYRSREDIPRP